MSGPNLYSGLACPNKIQFGRLHGTSPATGSVEVDGIYSLPLGSLQALQIGASSWYGLVVKNEVMEQATTIDPVSKVTMVDWRDTLHDTHLFGAFNMEDEDGRYYHITPDDWAVQRKTFLNRELDEQDWNQIQDDMADPTTIEVLACQGLFSGFSLINWISVLKSFIWTASPIALTVLKHSRPENLDWNSGVKVIEAIQQICQKNGLQFTVFGSSHLHVTLKGFSEDAFINCFLEGNCNICDIGGDTGSRGEELNERGRRALIIGDFNRYEYVFPCKRNWNDKWTVQLCYNGWVMKNLLFKHNLTLLNKVSELPEEYHDPEKFNGEPRNDLTIKEYIEQVAWHAYVVDASTVVDGELDVENHELPDSFNELDRTNLSIGNSKMFDRDDDPFNADYNFKYPISDSLLIDSQLKFVVFSSEELIKQGSDPPYAELKKVVPQESGAKLDIEATINTDQSSCQEEYRVRVMMNKATTIPSGGGDDLTGLLADREPDYVFCRLCLSGDLYLYAQGEGGAGVRLREQKRTVANLYKGFFNNEEQSILRGNFLDAVNEGPGQQPVNPVNADTIATRIATQMLFHEAINFSGNISYSDIAGAVPDGIIETVQTSWDPINGIKETVNFTTGILDTEVNIAFGVINQKLDLKTDEDQKRERIIESMRDAMKKAATAPGRGASTGSKVHAHEGGHISHGRKGKLFAKDGSVRVRVPKDVYSGKVIEDGEAMISE